MPVPARNIDVTELPIASCQRTMKTFCDFYQRVADILRKLCDIWVQITWKKRNLSAIPPKDFVATLKNSI